MSCERKREVEGGGGEERETERRIEGIGDKGKEKGKKKKRREGGDMIILNFILRSPCLFPQFCVVELLIN